MGERQKAQCPDHRHKGHHTKKAAIRIGLMAKPGEDHAANNTAQHCSHIGMEMIDQRAVNALIPRVKLRRATESVSKDAAQDKAGHSQIGHSTASSAI